MIDICQACVAQLELSGVYVLSELEELHRSVLCKKHV